MTMLFYDQVAMVTGAGTGLGRSHALALAAAGASVVVIDVGAALDGSGENPAAATEVANEIKHNGGIAVAEHVDVTDEAAVAAMIRRTLERFGRIDVLINNAGILRDRTFNKMSADDFRDVFDVHVMGAFHCTRAVWGSMREQRYGRILMTTSGSGLYGNFGQSNYAAAKMALVGLMNTLHLEGERYDIRVNALSPLAATRMTEKLMPPALQEHMDPAQVSPVALWLVSEGAPSKVIAEAGAGMLGRAFVLDSACAPIDSSVSLETAFGQLVPSDRSPESGTAHTQQMLLRAVAERGA